MCLRKIFNLNVDIHRMSINFPVGKAYMWPNSDISLVLNVEKIGDIVMVTLTSVSWQVCAM